MTTDIQPTLATRDATGRTARGTLLGAAAIFLLTVACHVPLLGNPPLAGTEGLRVIPARGMIRTGDWLLMWLYGQLYLIKPPLHDWLIAISEIVSRTGGNEFVWRMPSVIGAAILNVVLYLFGARWFGRIGGIVGGICGLGLLALWGQARTADVDGTNTLAATITFLCLIELHFGRPSRRWPWIWGGGLAFGAMLMTKGPAGMPIIVGELLWAAIHAGRNGGRRAVLRIVAAPSTWGPLLIGSVLFGAYAASASWAVHHLHTRPDISGLQEVNATLYPSNFKQLGWALLLPVQVFAFALPVSLSLPLVLVQGFRTAIRASGGEAALRRDRISDAVAASVLVSWLVCILSGMINPRYGYVTVAPLCILAGALAASVRWQSQPFASLFRAIVCGCVIILLGGYWFIAIALAWKGGIGRTAMIVAGAAATVIALIAFRRLTTRPSWAPAWGLPTLLMLTAVPFAYQFRVERNTHSGYAAGGELLRYVGPNATILSGEVLKSHPEMFFYAGANAKTCITFRLQNPRMYSGGYWVVLDPIEYQQWLFFAPNRLSRWSRITCARDTCHVAWLAREPTP